LQSESKIIFAFQGTLVESQHSAELLQLIKALNLGQPCLIKDYLNSATKNQDLKSLQILANAGAFVIL
ncbi:MAG: hypothetical protein ACXWC9_06485, partial [Pseudobdellovibrionaceae bacterium]